MIPDWKRMSDAPLGHYKGFTATNGVVKKQHIIKRLIVIRKGDEARTSHWMPDEERWHGYTKACPPDRWDFLPEWQDDDEEGSAA